MGEQFERPLFVDGQRLNADDLTALTVYGREPLAEHLRSQHRPGVMAGLALETNGSSSVIVKPGCFVDHFGQLVVVTADLAITLPTSLTRTLTDDGTNRDRSTPMPVFISASEQGAGVTRAAVGCGPSAVGRVVELATGRIARTGDSPKAPQIVDYGALDRGLDGQVSEIRLGAIIVDMTTKTVSEISDDPNLAPEHAGLTAGYIAGYGTQLSLAAGEAQLATGVSLVIRGDGIAIMRGSDELVTISGSGALSTKGDLKSGGQIVGSKGVGPAIVCGRAFGPIRLPLPAGFDESSVAPGADYVVSATLTPELVVAAAGQKLSMTAFGVDPDRVARCEIFEGAAPAALPAFHYSVTVIPR